MAEPVSAEPRLATTGGSVSASRLSSLVGPWWAENRVAITRALVVFLSLRVMLTIVAVLATVYLPEQQGLHYVFHRSHNVLLDVWARWDSEYYLDIAKYGYPLRSELLAFYPVYPVLMSTFAPLLGFDYVLSGVVVSSLSCFLALVYLYKLAAWEFGHEVAGRTILYIAVYPMAFFLLAVYTESTFLLLTVAAFYYARRGRWWAAALVAFLVPLTRSNGIVIVLPLAYEAWSQAGGGLQGMRTLIPRLQLSQIVAVIAAPLGFLTWLAYFGWLVQDPLAYVHRVSQPPWDRMTSAPWNTLITAIAHLGNTDLTTLSQTVNSVDLAVAVLLIEACVLSWWLLPRVYAIYLSASVLFLLSSQVADWPMQSMPRYAVVLFPCFFLLARLGSSPRWDRVILLIGAPLLGMFTALFATWYWVF